MIDVRNLHVHYPETHALKGINLSIAPDSFVLIGGPSGGGKSTLAHTLMGLIPQITPAKTEGSVSIAGLDPRQRSIAQIATQAGLVFQNPITQLFNGTVEEEIAFGPRNLGLSREEVTARVEYASVATGCAHLRHRAVRHLSSGEQQRVAIAATLSMRPSILILDEPTANLDSEGGQLLTRTLVQLHRQFQITLVVIEHRLSPFLPHADRLIWLADGRVIANGSPTETLAEVLPPLPPAPPPLPSTDEPLVALREVTVDYDGRPILRDCSLTLRRGDFAALVGPNGSGKTTLARVLAGLLHPRRGRVVWHANGKQPRVGFLQQNPLHQLVCDTVEEEVRFGPRNLRAECDKDIEAVLTNSDLHPLRYRPTRALSVGQQQRVTLAATLALKPALLILDEPTIGQDRQHLTQVMDFASKLNRQGQTALLITHDQRLVERYASSVWEIKEGKTQEAGDKSG
ncbi:MAG: ATP-binding cassette domain-containing protein [Anaerolineae bacterium]|nr:ATP-binding cassette domain-containing protein [Anaerolineae bacterium]